eukprot:1334128-Rhodomonas_salina.4
MHPFTRRARTEANRKMRASAKGEALQSGGGQGLEATEDVFEGLARDAASAKELLGRMHRTLLREAELRTGGRKRWEGSPEVQALRVQKLQRELDRVCRERDETRREREEGAGKTKDGELDRDTDRQRHSSAKDMDTVQRDAV